MSFRTAPVLLVISLGLAACDDRYLVGFGPDGAAGQRQRDRRLRGRRQRHRHRWRGSRRGRVGRWHCHRWYGLRRCGGQPDRRQRRQRDWRQWWQPDRRQWRLRVRWRWRIRRRHGRHARGHGRFGRGRRGFQWSLRPGVHDDAGVAAGAGAGHLLGSRRRAPGPRAVGRTARSADARPGGDVADQRRRPGCRAGHAAGPAGRGDREGADAPLAGAGRDRSPPGPERAQRRPPAGIGCLRHPHGAE